MRIAIFGRNSYIGKSFVSHYAKDTSIEFELIDSRDDYWQTIDFSHFDIIIYTAGIAHVSLNPKMESLYYAVNRDLPIKVAIKAKQEKVRQFIFLSSMIVFGDDCRVGDTFNITANTKPRPTNFYGKSKREAEEGLLALADESFSIAILRLPMVYGQGCKGNFPTLINLARKWPIFPNIENKRSMIYIDNLCAFISLCITNQTSGIVYPQNSEYVSTKQIVAQAAACMGKRIYFINIFNPLIRLFSKKFSIINKVFGNKTYDKSLSPDLTKYNIYTFTESIQRYFDFN